MPTTPLTVDELRKLIRQGEAADPLVFLEAVMNGQDPRKASELCELVSEIDGFSEGDIARHDWAEVVSFVTSNLQYQPVTLAESMTAGKTLAEYLHPKRKQVDISGLGAGAGVNAQSPLTAEEVELFREKFNEQF